jgi:hypothetical protein
MTAASTLPLRPNTATAGICWDHRLVPRILQRVIVIGTDGATATEIIRRDTAGMGTFEAECGLVVLPILARFCRMLPDSDGSKLGNVDLTGNTGATATAWQFARGCVSGS